MAWYDNLLQQGKGLYQQGQNWLTGNNLTSQDPNVQKAMSWDMADINNPNNQLQNESFSDLSYQDMGGVHPPRSHSGLRSIMPHYLGNWRSDMNPMNANWAPAYQPGQPFPHEGFEEMEFDETAQVPSKKGFQLPNIGILGIMKAMGERFKRPEAKQKEFETYQQSMGPEGWGDIGGGYQGNIWGDNKINVIDPTTGATILQNKNFDSMFGSDSVAEMIAKKEAWARDRRAKDKGLSSDLNAWLDKLDADKAAADAAAGAATGPVYQGPKTYDFDPGQFQREGRRPDKPGGFTDPGKGSYGPHKAQGGYMRRGYSRGGRVGILSVF